MNIYPQTVIRLLPAVLIVLVYSGCDHQPQEEVASVASEALSAPAGPPLEFFVFAAKCEVSRIGEPYKGLALNQLPGGSVLHFIEGSEHKLIATVNVPFGSAKTRANNKGFRI